jgi:glycosyltransferase involved in cell wall biosynthesis
LSRHREVILHENEGTLAKVCNEAIEKTQGEYIVRLDADDIIDPQLVE